MTLGIINHTVTTSMTAHESTEHVYLKNFNIAKTFEDYDISSIMKTLNSGFKILSGENLSKPYISKKSGAIHAQKPQQN